MKSIALIPARLESIRFPNKLVQKINGIPIILKTYLSAKETKLFDEVYVVSANDEILNIIEDYGGLTFKSLNDHDSGTDRIAEAAKNIEHDIVVNLQGDEPFIDKEAIGRLIKSFDDPDVKISSLMTNFQNFKEITNPNNVKVIVDNHNDAIYFSRLPIPYSSNKIEDFNRHIGIYAFTRESLIEFSKLERSKLEIIESLEGIRIIENSKKIRMIMTSFHGISIDTPEDLIKARKFSSSND
jgi:3-deoxy-manno-octulosonate cytidylyltransferase (CMP-KDO synthetase)